MIIVEQNLGLSETDMYALKGTSLFESMLRHRIVVKFNGVVKNFPNDIDFSQCSGFYHIRELDNTVFQLWFQNGKDYDIIRSELLAYKLSLTYNDK